MSGDAAVAVVLRQMQQECDRTYERLEDWTSESELGVELRVVEPGPDRLTVLAFSRGKHPGQPPRGTQVGIFRYYAGPAEALDGDRMCAGGVLAGYLGEDPPKIQLGDVPR